MDNHSETQKINRALFVLLNEVGERDDFPNLHIIDTTPEYPHYVGDCSYRVYHSDGYCLNVFRSAESEDENTGKTIYYYGFDADSFEGFKDISASEALELLLSGIPDKY